jgi:hypothetical protein
MPLLKLLIRKDKVKHLDNELNIITNTLVSKHQHKIIRSRYEIITCINFLLSCVCNCEESISIYTLLSLSIYLKSCS